MLLCRIFFLSVLVMSGLCSCDFDSSSHYYPSESKENHQELEKAYIDSRINYHKSFQGTSGSTHDYETHYSLFLAMCKRAEKYDLTWYVAQRFYEEQSNDNLIALLKYVKRRVQNHYRMEVYNMYQDLEKYPGMMERLSM